ncbi:MAG: hypothetical protein AB1393_02235 [Candidatus Edwardsbacteria bacterium]
MEKGISVKAKAIKEISKEKDRIFRRKIESPSLLEKAALAWKEKKEMEARLKQKEMLKKEESLGLSFRETIVKKVVDYDKQRLFDLSRAESRDEIAWVQYKPWQKEEDGKKKQIPLNMATIVALRKKLIAAEWARALGKRTQDTRLHDLEREAVVWKQRKEEEKRKKEEIRMRIEKHKEVLNEALIEFGERLKDQKDAADPKMASGLLEEVSENAGEVFDIEWQENRCLIWIEPWEEKKCRRISGFDIPIIYRVEIDENFQISSFEEVEDEEVIESLREELLTKPLRESLRGISFNIDNEDEARQLLEDKFSEIGRLISLERTADGWLATIEPWEEMRLRNVKRKGKPPIVTEEIEIGWKDGKLEFVPEEEADIVNQEKGGGKEDE